MAHCGQLLECESGVFQAAAKRVRLLGVCASLLCGRVYGIEMSGLSGKKLADVSSVLDASAIIRVTRCASHRRSHFRQKEGSMLTVANQTLTTDTHFEEEWVRVKKAVKHAMVLQFPVDVRYIKTPS